MFLKPFLALAALFALIQFSVALNAEKPGVSLRRPFPPLAKRTLGNPILTKVKHTNLAVPAVRRNLVAESRAIESRDSDECEEEDYGYCDSGFPLMSSYLATLVYSIVVEYLLIFHHYRER